MCTCVCVYVSVPLLCCLRRLPVNSIPSSCLFFLFVSHQSAFKEQKRKKEKNTHAIFQTHTNKHTDPERWQMAGEGKWVNSLREHYCREEERARESCGSHTLSGRQRGATPSHQQVYSVPLHPAPNEKLYWRHHQGLSFFKVYWGTRSVQIHRNTISVGCNL